MDLGDALQQVVEAAGYEIVDHDKEEAMARLMNARQSNRRQLQILFDAWVQQGRIRRVRPQFLNRKDDEAFRLFADDPEKPSSN